MLLWKSIPDEKLLANFSSVKSYTLQGLEDVTYMNEKLKAKMIYSAELIKPGAIGRN
jgi:hypothetical protein